MNFRRLVDMLMQRPTPPYDERSIKTAQTERLRMEVGAALDRVDRIVPPSHARLASYRRIHLPR